MTVLLAGATIDPLPPKVCLDLLEWAAGRGEPPTDAGDPEWLLAQCDDGVIWGHRRTPDRSWLLSCQVFVDLTATLTPRRVQELRLFGPGEELLVWRDDDTLAGRRLVERTDTCDWGDCDPIPDMLVLIGDRWQDARQGFTLVADGAGSRQAVPMDCDRGAFAQPGRTGTTWPLRLRLRHYLTSDGDTGSVRVVATRLVEPSCRRSHT